MRYSLLSNVLFPIMVEHSSKMVTTELKNQAMCMDHLPLNAESNVPGFLHINGTLYVNYWGIRLQRCCHSNWKAELFFLPYHQNLTLASPQLVVSGQLSTVPATPVNREMKKLQLCFWIWLAMGVRHNDRMLNPSSTLCLWLFCKH